MKIPFRYQFILAPFVIVVILASLVAYTLFELTNINHGNGVVRQWEYLTDGVQTTISSATRLNKTIHGLSSVQEIQQDEHFFNYLEQTQILMDNFDNPNLLEKLSPKSREKISTTENLLLDPEHINPYAVILALNELLSTLEYQYKIFAAQRRTAFIDNHHQLVTISSRLTMVLITALILCITLATGLAIWGLFVIRGRLKLITQRAHAVCDGEVLPLRAPVVIRDELDDLESCLANMTKRLINVVSVENVLRGVESERKRIAMDMHDGVLVDLTSINRKLDGFKSNPIGQSDINALRGDIDDIIRNLRRTIDDLHPQILEILGLEPALSSFLERHKAEAGFPNYHFEFDEKIETSIPVYHKINLFRIIIESINNIVKHAHCDQFEVCLRIVSKRLIATVEDNGVGNDKCIPSHTHATGHGCANISERANLIGGTAQWRVSRFASGLCFELTLPLALSE